MSEPETYEVFASRIAPETLPQVNERLYMKWAGLRATAVGPGYSRIELQAEPHHRGGGGTPAVNGGILSYMVDMGAGLAVRSTWTETDRSQVTITMNIHYLRPAYGERVIAESRVLTRGKSVATVETEIRNERGDLCTKALSTYRIFPKELGPSGDTRG